MAKTVKANDEEYAFVHKRNLITISLCRIKNIE